MSIRVLAVLALLTATEHATAHHAFAANFDVGNTGTIEGRIEEIFWANPHVHFYVQVDTVDGGHELWDVEWMNLGSMRNRGWSRTTLNVGDEISVTGTLGRDGKRRIWVDKVVRLNGPPLP